MEKLKYILDDYGNFAIFSDTKAHSDIARGFHFKPVSAGFCTIAVGHYIKGTTEEKESVNVHCFGESLSLNLKSREEDEDIINKNI